jgi:hypothetical protein
VKRALLGLVFANIVVFGYLRMVAQPPPMAAPAASVPRLDLVGERHAPLVPAPLRCVSVGPLRDTDALHAVGEYLRGLGLKPRERSQESAAPPQYGVIATRKSAALAARIVQQLRAAGVADVELVPPAADQAEAQVSLGMYEDRARAERRIQDLKNYALSPTIVERPRRLTRWWLDLETEGAAPPIDVAALLKAVPAAAGASPGPCVLQLPPAELEVAPPAVAPPVVPKPAKRTPAAAA